MTATLPPTTVNRVVGCPTLRVPVVAEATRDVRFGSPMEAMLHYREQLRHPDLDVAERAAEAIFELEKTRLRLGHEIPGMAGPAEPRAARHIMMPLARKTPLGETPLNHEFSVGDETWTVAIPPEKRLEPRGGISVLPAASLHDLVRDALEKPYQFEPLRRALTPDDRVAIVVDESLPKLAKAVAAVLEHLGTAGIAMDTVTLILRPESRADWIDELPDEFADVKTEVHDPDDRKKLAYLAATKSGRRIYLNRTLVESDFAIVIGGRRFDPEYGLAGAEELLLPLLSDSESIATVRGTFRYKTPSPDPDAIELAMLFGSPFFVQVIDDGNRAVEVVAGLPNSLAEGVRRHDAHWKLSVTEKPETVVATVSANPRFPELAMAALNAARIVAKGGRIVLLAPPMDISGEGVTVLRNVDDPGDARKILAKMKPDDWTACHLWATAARRGRLYVANLDADFADELFANGIENAREVERLLESSGTILILPNAHRAIVEVDGGETE